MTMSEETEGAGTVAEKVIAKPVYAFPGPILLDARLTKITEAIKVLYGPDTRLHQFGRKWVVFTDGELCSCLACDTFMRKVADLDYMELPGGMIVCSVCGNKRCPHATDHEEDCTASNMPGQPGSSYPSIAESLAARREREQS